MTTWRIAIVWSDGATSMDVVVGTSRDDAERKLRQTVKEAVEVERRPIVAVINRLHAPDTDRLVLVYDDAWSLVDGRSR